MISCPDDRELLELVDGELATAHADDVVEHLAECEDCRLSLGRSEASLTYALGGIADTGRWSEDAPVETPEISAAPRPTVWRTPLVGLAAAACLVVALGLALGPDRNEQTPTPQEQAARTTPPPRPEQLELRHLLARAEAIRSEASATTDERDLLAAGALAAAEARVWTVGRSAARPRVQDVIDRFPGTTAAREARALLASAEWSDVQ